MTLIGNYIVASGIELKVRPTHRGYLMYHVTDKSGMLMGSYPDEEMAVNLATGLDRIDRAKIDKEIDGILRSK